MVLVYLHLANSKNVSSTLWTGSFHCGPSVFQFSFLGVFYLPFCSAFYTVCFNHSKNHQTTFYLGRGCKHYFTIDWRGVNFSFFLLNGSYDIFKKIEILSNFLPIYYTISTYSGFNPKFFKTLNFSSIINA